MHEPSTDETPRSILENVEKIPDPSHEELAYALGRLLAWILEPGRLTQIGERAIIVGFKIRPDLIGGATLDEIAKRRGCGVAGAPDALRVRLLGSYPG